MIEIPTQELIQRSCKFADFNEIVIKEDYWRIVPRGGLPVKSNHVSHAVRSETDDIVGHSGRPVASCPFNDLSRMKEVVDVRVINFVLRQFIENDRRMNGTVATNEFSVRDPQSTVQRCFNAIEFFNGHMARSRSCVVEPSNEVSMNLAA
jgi:hypothetical protein